MIASRIRLILGLELIAYFFAAPYIILLGLDENRGVLGADVSMDYRLWAYALLLGIYPFLLMLVSPYIGRQLDQRRSKISVLRKIHLANSTCYLLLGAASWLHNYPLAILALCIPGVVGCASPVGKSLVASLTQPEVRTQEFAKLAFMKGVAKLSVPLLGAFVFKVFLGESSYTPLFVVSAILSLSCFLYSFTFPHLTVLECESPLNCQSPPISTYRTLIPLIRKNYSLLLAFVVLVTGYSVFVKYTPFVIFEKIGNNPSIVNYFASMVGLAFTLNQFIIFRYADRVKKLIGAIFAFLCSMTILLCFMPVGPFWFLSFFGILFCFSVLMTCIEASLSLQGGGVNQGTVQGFLYSVENWGYIIAPIIGSFVASFSTLSPFYFVISLAFMAAAFYAHARFKYQASLVAQS